MSNSIHKFHIPVMGLAFTIDSPIKVARYGIDSVISIVEDRLIELMRGHYYEQIKEAFHPITNKEPDHRAKRITDYLNLVNKLVHEQFEQLKASAFEAGSEIVKYFELLPDDSKLKQLYQKMIHLNDPVEKEKLGSLLRAQMKPGSIDVNIMTKVDKNNYNKQGDLVEDGSDALAALRGYANSELVNSSIIFSAGMNPRLYNYMEKLPAFAPGNLEKKVVIKVSDYRSALIQGKYLAKKGIWVSEYRIESGLNCGGHAFASDGYLLGPILETFRLQKEELVSSCFAIYKTALESKNLSIGSPLPVKITVQGGIGTYEEDTFLHQHYGVDGTGWGTPFLLVPEATTVEDDTLDKLCNAEEGDVVLSKNSPLGVRFNYLKGTSSAIEKQERMDKGRPGSSCPDKLLISNTEFTTEPICTASRQYQELKIAQLQSLNLPKEAYEKELEDVLSKECLCVGLTNSAIQKYNLKPLKGLKAVTICPGPNIEWFSRRATLKEMTDHIYGRANLITKPNRPNLFIKEIQLYMDYLHEQLEVAGDELTVKKRKYFMEFITNLQDGINYYKLLAKNDKEHSDLLEPMYPVLNKVEMELVLLRAGLQVRGTE